MPRDHAISFRIVKCKNVENRDIGSIHLGWATSEENRLPHSPANDLVTISLTSTVSHKFFPPPTRHPAAKVAAVDAPEHSIMKLHNACARTPHRRKQLMPQSATS